MQIYIVRVLKPKADDTVKTNPFRDILDLIRDVRTTIADAVLHSDFTN